MREVKTVIKITHDSKTPMSKSPQRRVNPAALPASKRSGKPPAPRQPGRRQYCETGTLCGFGIGSDGGTPG
jgi:hypothetical protein